MSTSFDPQSLLCGWVDHPDRLETAAQLGPPLSQLAPKLYLGDIPDNIFLFKAWKDVLGAYPNYPAQQIGDCTSFGSGHTMDLVQAVEIAIGKQGLVYHETCTEAIYGAGRKIGGMLGGGDGCYGSAVAKACTDWGCVPRDKVGPYSGQRAKSWGRSGPPAELDAYAAEHKLGAAAMVTTTADLDAALANGYPAIICSNQGFTQPRDADGVCYPRGRWPHCMSISGRRLRNGKLQYLVDQSWGNDLPGGPLTDDQPVFSFWTTGDAIASILRQQDSFAFSKFGGFEQRPLPAHWTWSDWAA